MVSWFWMPRRGDRFGGLDLPENRLAHGSYHSTATEMPINSLGFAAIDSPGKSSAASGVFRVFGSWELYNRGETNNGSIVFKVENRHAYSDVAPSAFGGELGYAGLTSSVFSDQGWRTSHLFWQQRFANGRGISYLGFLDTTDYVDVYPLASPWSGFANIALLICIQT